MIKTWCLVLLACVGCRSVPSLPPADLSAPGWKVQQGQAIWKPTKSRPELAGELLLATNPAGDCFVQFTKTPFSIVTAQRMNDTWQIEFGDGKNSWCGQGEPPRRFVWFQLPGAFARGGVGGGWSFVQHGTNIWRFENPRTGETLEGGFVQ